MISKSELESLAKKLMFEMNDDEYETLEKEFDVIIRYGGVCVLLFMWQQDTEYGQRQRLR